MAREKAKRVQALRPDAIVIGADQVAFNEDGSFGKPRDPEDHLKRLLSLRGRTHVLTTGVVLLGPGVDEEVSVNTGIVFRSDLTRSELQAYVNSGEGAVCRGISN